MFFHGTRNRQPSVHIHQLWFYLKDFLRGSQWCHCSVLSPWHSFSSLFLLSFQLTLTALPSVRSSAAHRHWHELQKLFSNSVLALLQAWPQLWEMGVWWWSLACNVDCGLDTAPWPSGQWLRHKGKLVRSTAHFCFYWASGCSLQVLPPAEMLGGWSRDLTH